MRHLALAFCLLAATPALADEAGGDVGPAVWTKRCAGCHGADGKGDTKVGKKYKIADLSDASWPSAWTQPRVQKLVEDGIEGKMPAWKSKLTPEEIAAVSRFVFTLAPKPGHK